MAYRKKGKNKADIVIKLRARGAPRWSYKKQKKHMQSATRYAVEAHGDYLKKEAKKNASAKGKPVKGAYSKKPNARGTHPSNRGIVAPWWRVHRGETPFPKSVVGSIIRRTKFDRRGPYAEVKYKQSGSAKHVSYVVEGTRIMWPRDVITRTRNQKEVRQKGFALQEKMMRRFINQPGSIHKKPKKPKQV